MTDTIYALASGRGRAGVAVLRVSGPAAGAALCRLSGAALPAARRAVLRRFRDPGTGEMLDRGLAIWFPAPHSYTGEDMVEFHVHAGPAVLEGMVEALASIEGARPAEAGEFTRRAFLGGKLDLTEAEGIVDLVAAETAAQRRQALRQMEGALGRLYEDWRARLVRVLAHVEASIDFADEELPSGLLEDARTAVSAVEHEMLSHLADSHRGERLRDGVVVAIIGPPNAGKSTLLNRLAQRDAAIVSPIAGTTRDVIDIDLDMDGFPVRVADTAGLRSTGDVIEAEGVRRAERRAASADVKLLILDATTWPEIDPCTEALIDDATIVAVNKVDLRPIPEPNIGGARALTMSLATGEGFDAVRERLGARVRELSDSGGTTPVLTRARHRAAVEECAAALGRFRAVKALELAAEDLRLAARALGRVTGRVGVEELLDVIFREFCIGK